MSKLPKKLLFWIPRVLTILFAGFLSIFAMDVFSEGHTFWETILAFSIHLLPTWIVLLVLAISWRWEWVGGIMFSAFGLLYVVTTWGKFPLAAYFAIAGPLFLIGLLFFLSWAFREEIRAGR